MFIIDSGASHLAVVVKSPPANADRLKRCWVPSLSQEDPLEEGMATHPGILAREIPWTEEPGGLQSMGLKRVRHDYINLAEHTIVITTTTTFNVGETLSNFQ